MFHLYISVFAFLKCMCDLWPCVDKTQKWSWLFSFFFYSEISDCKAARGCDEAAHPVSASAAVLGALADWEEEFSLSPWTKRATQEDRYICFSFSSSSPINLKHIVFTAFSQLSQISHRGQCVGVTICFESLTSL